MILVAAKNHFKIPIYLTIALLIASVGGSLEVKAAFPQVFVYPPSQTINALRNVLTANVCVSDIFNLYAYEFKLYYNSTVLNGTSVTEGSFLEESGQTPFFYVEAFTDHYNSTYGIVWIDSTLVGNVLGIDGDGVLATIQFRATAPGNSTSLSLRDVNLSDPNENPIPYVSSDGTVTVLSKNTENPQTPQNPQSPQNIETIMILTIILIILILIPILFITRKMRKKLDLKLSLRHLEKEREERK